MFVTEMLMRIMLNVDGLLVKLVFSVEIRASE